LSRFFGGVTAVKVKKTKTKNKKKKSKPVQAVFAVASTNPAATSTPAATTTVSLVTPEPPPKKKVPQAVSQGINSKLQGFSFGATASSAPVLPVPVSNSMDEPMDLTSDTEFPELPSPPAAAAVTVAPVSAPVNSAAIAAYKADVQAKRHAQPVPRADTTATITTGGALEQQLSIGALPHSSDKKGVIK
jgi:hypothetical protein